MITKRKYVRKSKKPDSIEKVLDLHPDAKPILDTEELPDISKCILRGYSVIKLFIYLQVNDVDSLLYLKKFQRITDKLTIGTRVVIYSKGDHVENMWLNNCFVSELENWLALCDEKDIPALLIKERPRMSPEELYKLIRDKREYEDDFIKLQWID